MEKNNRKEIIKDNIKTMAKDIKSIKAAMAQKKPSGQQLNNK